jgi:hypothetical protein
MQMLASFDDSSAIPAMPPCESQVLAEMEIEAIRMRALRRKARRVSAYARFNVDMLNALAAEVETDIASLQH